MEYAIPTSIVLAAGVVLALVAQWKGWRPSPAVTLTLGIAVRVLIMVLAAKDTKFQPIDYVNSFQPAGRAIVEGRDPVLESNGGWHFLPMIPYLYGLLLWLGVTWDYAGRIVTVVADIALIPLVGRLAGGRTAKLRAFQYACSPLAILVASVHGQVEPVSLVFGVAAYVVARGPGDWRRPEPLPWARLRIADRALPLPWIPPGEIVRRLVRPSDEDRAATWRAAGAGALMGLALCAKSWPVILVPAMLMFLPGLRSRLVALVAVAVPPVFFLLTLPIGGWTEWRQLPEVLNTIGLRPSDVRPITGDWGWTALVSGGNWNLDPTPARIGQYLIYASIVACLVWWRRADPVDVTIAILLSFMIFTPRLGAQYLLWFMPFLVARPTRWAWPAILGSTLWAAAGYIVLTQFHGPAWMELHAPWAISSLLIFPLLAAAIPWKRRYAEGTPLPSPDGRARVQAL
ncbi:hypothetical protein [Microbispora amethystogenes]|uniref:DUF2029 domain-containing protein n=1 Tax=Microbispora amethystogenes TaxID=1427754 RepID=A0ABQ4FQ45_9ACTN|nr:hypothetical protein [Microbispora amethystogenes]GIH36920.1 hypothetical protein Mam01_70840 [Microbispora amethystogenes]